MKELILICAKRFVSLVIYYFGVILVAMSVLLVVASSAAGYWWMPLPGVPLLLVGGWIQHKNWGW